MGIEPCQQLYLLPGAVYDLLQTVKQCESDRQYPV